MNLDKRFPTPVNDRSQPRDNWGALFAIPLIGLGIAMGLQSQNSTLLCDRTTPTQVECRLLQANIVGSLLGKDKAEVSLGLVQSAELLVRISANGQSDRVMLLTPEGKRELTDFSNIGQPDEVVNRINDFILDRQEKTLEIQQQGGWFASAFAAILILTGLGKIVTFNKSKSRPVPFLR